MKPIKTLRDLRVWQCGMDIARAIYRETGAMPKSEQFGLTMQMRRAASSIPSNVAEGYGRHSRKDYLRHLRIARGSRYELATQYELATSLEMLSSADKVLELFAEEDRMLHSLITKLDK